MSFVRRKDQCLVLADRAPRTFPLHQAGPWAVFGVFEVLGHHRPDVHAVTLGHILSEIGDLVAVSRLERSILRSLGGGIGR